MQWLQVVHHRTTSPNANAFRAGVVATRDLVLFIGCGQWHRDGPVAHSSLAVGIEAKLLDEPQPTSADHR
jgi:hypothetical protein